MKTKNLLKAAFVGLFSVILSTNPVSANNYSVEDVLGYWIQKGYGRVIDVSKNEIKLYDICKVSCLPVDKFSNVEIENQLEFLAVTETSFTMKMGLNIYQYDKLDQLPDLCANSEASNKNDPMYNFESLWHTFNEQYAYFETRKIDWQAIKEKYRSKITKNTSDLELFYILEEMLTDMNDGHVSIEVPDKLRKEYTKDKKKKTKLKLKDGAKRKSVNIDRVFKDINDKYIPNHKSFHFGKILWSKIKPEVAYLRIDAMGLMANYDLGEGSSKGKAEKIYTTKMEASLNYTKDEIDGTRFIMDSIFAEFKNTESLIIDMRFNGGGFDEVALEMLRTIATTEASVFTKKARDGDGFTKINEVELTPIENSYKGDVYILTSRFTASAAEIFMMSSLVTNPNAVRIGSNTEGIFSDILEKQLPNGWSYGLSNEIYYTMEGEDLENKGVAPNHFIDYSDSGYKFILQLKTEMENGGDQAIEKALELIENKK